MVSVQWWKTQMKLELAELDVMPEMWGEAYLGSDGMGAGAGCQ